MTLILQAECFWLDGGQCRTRFSGRAEWIGVIFDTLPQEACLEVLLSRLFSFQPGKYQQAIDLFQQNCDFVIAHYLLNRMM